MAMDKKYAALPDLDSAPDVYETPELTDGASTLQTSPRSRSVSPISSKAHHPDISQTSLSSTRDTRSHFSSRVKQKRREHRNASTGDTQKHTEREVHELGDFSDDDSENESLGRKMARLKREMEEVKEEVGRRKYEHQKAEGVGNAAEDASVKDVALDEDGSISTLNQLMEDISPTSFHKGARNAASADLVQRLQQRRPSKRHSASFSSTSRAQLLASEPEVASETRSQALRMATEFEQRLTTMESHLGISAALGNEPAMPVLSTLNTLANKITALNSQLSSSSSAALEALGQKIQQIIKEAEPVSQFDQIRYLREQSALITPTKSSTETPLTPAMAEKINSLHSFLPTLTQLSPTLPPLLERLRSLRRLHADAAASAQGLDELEHRQEGLESEIAKWREGLVKLEEKVNTSEGTLVQNVKTVEEWVKGLEVKMKANA